MESSDVNVLTLCYNLRFFEIYGVSARIRWVGAKVTRSHRHFSNKGGGVNFLRFCADVFYERPVMQKPSVNTFSKTIPIFIRSKKLHQ